MDPFNSYFFFLTPKEPFECVFNGHLETQVRSYEDNFGWMFTKF